MVSRREIHNRRNNKKQISFFLLKIVALFVLAMFMVSLALYKFKPQVFYFIMNDAISVIKTQQKREDLSRYVEEINTNKEKAKFVTYLFLLKGGNHRKKLLHQQEV